MKVYRDELSALKTEVDNMSGTFNILDYHRMIQIEERIDVIVKELIRITNEQKREAGEGRDTDNQREGEQHDPSD